MPLLLRWKGSTRLPVEADIIRPDRLKNLSTAEVTRLSTLVGNQTVEIGDLFEVQGNALDEVVRIEGDLKSLKRLGRGMNSGLLEITGDVGPHLGRGMTVGNIIVHGSAGDGAGMAMKGGLIYIRGNAGDRVGAAEPGERIGMRDGMILVDGTVGDHAGSLMRRGLIAVGGRVGESTAHGMIAGSIFAFGAVGSDLGAGMKRGTIAIFGDDPPRIGPTFAASGRDRPPFVNIYLKAIRECGFTVPKAAFSGEFSRYNGDRVEGGQGEILVSAH